MSQTRKQPEAVRRFWEKDGAEIQGHAQNKVLAIMEHRFFEKQVYLCTGSQKITERGGNFE
jgi:hypothetical protein